MKLQVPSLLYFFNTPPPPEIYTLSLHDALPICESRQVPRWSMTSSVIELTRVTAAADPACSKTYARPISKMCEFHTRSEEHTSELQSRRDLVCRLLLEKKKKKEIGNQTCRKTK